ncbi:hypothetical protein [Hyalangium gracile]|uniref:hypothetical protein n=1 Tax=Hyalangium gracile TaxID=394092 RepID=UPI001CCF3E39|nr:hypothetical protein [Hyalangium gracile]
MLTPLLLTLVVLQQAPASPPAPIPVLIAPPDTAGVPGHVVEFAQEHVADQARAKGLTVIRMKDFIRKVPAARRRTLLRCKRTDLKCLTALGQAARSEVVLVAELLQRMDGYRVGTKVYKTQDGGLVAEHLIPGVREDGMLDALTQSLDVVVPAVMRELRPGSLPPLETKPPEVKPPEVKPPETPTETKPPETPTETKPTEVKPPPLVEKPPEARKEPEPSGRRWAWAPAAGGVVFAGAGTYFYLQAKDDYDTLTTQGGNGQLLDGSKLASDGKRNQLLSRVSFGLAAAGIVTSAVLYLLPAEKAPVSPTVSVGPGGGMVGVVGTLP